MADKNEYYSDFSNRRPFNNVPCREDEVLVPVVVDDEMKDTLKNSGLDWNNLETWHYPYGRKVPVAFIQVKEDQMEAAMTVFRKQVNGYLKRYEKTKWDDLVSIDDLQSAMSDDERTGFDPTATTENEDNAFLEMLLEELIEELDHLDPEFGMVIRLLAEGYNKGEILRMLDLKKGKSQGYSYIKKIQEMASKLWHMNKK